MLSDDARKVAGRLAVHGYTPKDGLPVDQLTDYLPDLRRDQLMAAVRELEDRGSLRWSSACRRGWLRPGNFR
jgi:hypothetical protein